MATIFTINNVNELNEVRSVLDMPYDHEKRLFSVENKRVWSKNDLTRLKISSSGCDVFSVDCHYATKPHWNYRAEERWILSGSGRFFIPTTDYMYVIDVVPGDLIWLSPCLQHWFETTSITAARYFSDDVAHIEQTDNLSDEVIKWNKQCFLTGFVPKL